MVERIATGMMQIMSSLRIRRAALVLAGMAFVLVAAPAFCQGCALCYTQAASSGARMIQALRSGILVLILPPMFMSAGITVVAYRRRNHFHESDSETDADSATDSEASCNMERQIFRPPLPGDKWHSRN